MANSLCYRLGYGQLGHEMSAIKVAVANTVIATLEKLAHDHSQLTAEDVATGYLIGIQIWLKNTRGPRLAYDAFQNVADDIAETMIRVRS